MADFSKCLPDILKHEGGDKYTNYAWDPGGPTKFGITLKTLTEWRGHTCSADDVKALKLPEASEIYKKRYWDVCRCDEIADQQLANKICDMSVNMGPHQAVILCQRACNALGLNLAVDGLCGPTTLKAINEQRAGILVCGLIVTQTRFYRALHEQMCVKAAEMLSGRALEQRLNELSAQLKGWLVRASYPNGY